jgi:protein TonB
MFSTLMAEQSEQRARRGRRRTWILTGSLALHAAALAVLAGFQLWQVEAVAEPQLVDVFEVQLPPPPQAEPAAPAPAHHQPTSAAPLKAVQPAPPEVRQPDPAVLDKHPDVPAPQTSPDPAAATDQTGPTDAVGTGSRDASGHLSGTGGDGPPGVGEVGDGPPLPIGGPITRPQIVPGTRVQPIYTELARRAHVQGVVVLQATIDERGNVIDIRILKQLPMGLTGEAVKAVSQWKFTPATLHGRPVKVFFSVTVQFEER